MRLILFAYMLLLLPLQSYALTETTVNTNSCGSEYAVASLDGVSSDLASTTSYYVSNWDTNKNIYFSFTPNASGDVTLSEGVHPWGSQMKVKFYVGTSCSDSDVVSSNGLSKTHGPFNFSVTAGQTYYIYVRKQSNGYMRFSMTYDFTATVLNQAPAANDKTFTTTTNTALSGNVMTDGGTADSDPDGDPITVTANTAPSNGSVTVDANGTFTYTPNSGYEGSDSFTYTISDGSETATATVTVTTVATVSNHAPTANDKTFTTTTDTALSGNVMTDGGTADSDSDGDAITVTANTAPSNGSVTVATDGAFTYTPNSGYEGADSFTYTISDGNVTATATVTVTTYGSDDEVIPTDSADAVTAVCGSFEDVLQTRDSGSDIHQKSGASADVYDNPDCTLNTGDVDFGNWQHLSCDQGGDMTETGTYGDELTVTYTNPPDSATVDASPSSSAQNITLTTSQTLSDTAYDKVEVGSGSTGSLAVSFSQMRQINTLNFTTDNSVEFAAPTPYNLEIGSVGIVNNGSGNSFTTATIPKNIKINTFSLPGNTTIDFEASQTIKMETLEIGRYNTSVTLRAPYVQINTLNQSNNYGGASTVTIYADYVDIGTLDLDQQATISIKPYTSGQRILFRANTIEASSSSTMIVDSGNYYTSSFDIPGSSNVSSIRASDSDQLINFFIDGDFNPGNNPGINSDGNNGDYGTLPPENFFFFVNGDLNTGGGGTTFNATVYVEGETDFGSPSYLKGALSSGGDIEIGNNSEFYYDQDIADGGWGDCSAFGPPANTNTYSCGMFGSVLTSYEHIDASSSNNAQACFTENISYPAGELDGDIVCSASGCGGTESCDRIEPPTNRYTITFPTNSKSGTTESSSPTLLQDLEYGDITYGNNSDVTFDPQETYSDDNSTSVMLLGDISFQKSTLRFEPGDYYFDSLSILSNNNDVIVNGNGLVRLFIKGDFTVAMNNLDFNTGGSEEDLFVYVGGDFISSGSGGGTTAWKAFTYIKGDVTLNNNSNNWTITGGITAEGTITIDGNNPDFIQSGDPDNFGLGSCKLCYDPNYVQTNGFFGLCSFFTPCTLDIPIRNIHSQELDNVIVTETYNSSMTMSFPMGSTYDTLDQNGTSIGNGGYAVTDADYSMFPLAPTLSLNTEANVYDFGDNYPTYSPNDTYYRAYKRITMSMNFDFFSWFQNIVFLGNYTDEEGRNYAVQLEECTGVGGSSDPVLTGLFDAWDTFRSGVSGSPADINISTKIVASAFSLTIASMNVDNNGTEAVEGKESQYRIYDNVSGSGMTVWYDFNASASASITSSPITVNQATSEAYVQFRFCQKINSSPIEFGTFNDCETNATYYEYNASLPSTDGFAIRPNAFDVNITSGQQFRAASTASLRFLALNVNGTANGNDDLANKSVDYNETEGSSFSIDLNLTDNTRECEYETAQNSPNVAFANGAHLEDIAFDHIGEYNLTIHEVSTCSLRFAGIDCDDGAVTGHWSVNTALADDNLSITTKAVSVVITPDHFEIVGNYTNHGNNFTYLSNFNDANADEMASEYNVTVTAKRADNSDAENYTSTCYAQNLDLNFSYDTHGANLSGKLDNIMYFEPTYVTSYQESALSDTGNFTIAFTDTIFVPGDDNGSANLLIKINFDRDKTKVVNPFDFELLSLTTTDDNGVSNTESINQEAKFLYGRVHAPRYRVECSGTGACSTATSPNQPLKLYAEFYYDLDTTIDANSSLRSALLSNGEQRSVDSVSWYYNKRHTATDGEITAIAQYIGNTQYTSTPLDPQAISTISSGVSTVNVNYDGSDDYPYKATMNLTAPSWLIYSRFNASAERNEFALEFNAKILGNQDTNTVQDANFSNPNTSRRILW